MVQEMLIYTTPIFAPIFLNSKWIYIHNSIGYFPKLIPIPSHYAKVIVAKASINSTPVVFIGAFLVPNNSNVNPHVCIQLIYLTLPCA